MAVLTAFTGSMLTQTPHPFHLAVMGGGWSPKPFHVGGRASPGGAIQPYLHYRCGPCHVRIPGALPAPPGAATPSLVSSGVSPDPALTAADVARLVAKGVAAAAATTDAAPAKVPAPSHTSFKFPNFDGSLSQFTAHNRAVTQSLEMPCFDPSPSGELVTTALNAVESAQLRNCLHPSLKGAAAAHFTNRNDLIKKGFEMVAILRDAYAPIGRDVIFPIFNSLFSLEQKGNEAMATYMSRIRDINAKLRAGGVDLPPVLLNMFTVRGLGPVCEAVKQEFALESTLFSTLTLEDVERKCDTYTSALTAMGGGERDSYASVAAKAPEVPQPPKAEPAPAADSHRPPYPPARPPPGKIITSLMKKVDTQCPVCHMKHHGLTTCGYCLCAGYVVMHDPDKVAELLKGLDLGHGDKPAASGKPSPATSIAQAPLAPASSPPPPPSVPPKTERNEDDAEIQAAATESLTASELDEMIFILDDESSLVEAEGIMSAAECSSSASKASVDAYTAPPVDKLTAVCAIASNPVACAVARDPPSGSPMTHQRSVVTLRPTTIYKLAAALPTPLAVAASGARIHGPRPPHASPRRPGLGAPRLTFLTAVPSTTSGHTMTPSSAIIGSTASTSLWPTTPAYPLLVAVPWRSTWGVDASSSATCTTPLPSDSRSSASVFTVASPAAVTTATTTA